MTRITNADQVLVLLRNRLERAQRSQRRDATQRSAKREDVKQTPVERMQGIAQSESLPESEVERALISGLFMEEFGAAAANDPKFQLMIDEVLKMIRQEPATRRLLDRAVAQLTNDLPNRPRERE